MATKSHVVLPGSKRGKDPLAERVGDVDPKEIVDATIGLAGPKLPNADDLVGQRLTQAELTERFGAKQADADAVARSLKKFGIKVVDISLATRSMRVRGTAAAMEKAFRPNMSIMRSAQIGEYRGRQGSLSIPTELRGLITGVFGLDQRKVARRKVAAMSIPGKRTSKAAAPLAPLGPADLERRYNFPPGDGAGQRIAIAEFGGGYFAEDLSTYCNKFQRAVPVVQAISVDAPAYTLQEVLALPPQLRGDELDTSIEVMMDVQIIAGLCPRAEISVYFSTFDQRGWVDLLDRVIADQPLTLSISWGLAEDDPDWSANAVNAINDRLNAARLLGITVCVSSGDDGSGDQIDDGHGHVDFPSTSPYVLSVGGTMLRTSAGKVREVTWWDSPGRRTNAGGGSTGGGVSTMFDRPQWQNVNVKSINTGLKGRVMPDVAALAGDPGYDLIFVGKSQPNGGTSASAPLWAALVARINASQPPAKQQRFLTPLLYQADADGRPVGKTACRDITSGNNISFPEPGKGYKAKAGFDAVTGWGVPDGVKLAEALAKI